MRRPKFQAKDKVEAVGMYAQHGKGKIIEASYIRNDVAYSVRFDSRKFDMLIPEQYLKKV